MVLFTLMACWLGAGEVDHKLGGGDPSVGLVDTGPWLDPLVIQRVEPNWGPVDVETEVQVFAAPLAEQNWVWVEGVSATVRSSSESSLAVTLPRGEVGWSSIKLKSGGRENLLDNAFRYYPDNSGLASLVGVFEWRTYLTFGFNISGLSVPDDHGSAWLKAVQPQAIDFGLLALGTSLDWCALDYVGPGVQSVDLGRGSLVLSGPSEVTLLHRPETESYEASISREDFVDGSTYDLVEIGADDWPSMSVPGAVRLPNPFEVYSPDFRLGNSLQPEMVFSWETAGAADYIAIVVDRYDASFFGTPKWIDTVSCKVRDDGEFVLPMSVWSSWDPGGPLVVSVGRVRQSDVRLPHDHSGSAAVGIWWNIGFAYQY